MQWWHAILLGLVEGITEYLPVSSTGHLDIARTLLGLDQVEVVNAASKDFVIVIQGGAILAVLGLYWPRVRSMFAGIVGGDRAGARLALNLFIAFLPAAFLGLLLDDVIDANLRRPAPILLALLLGGFWMIWIDRWRRRNESLGESSALIPGGDIIDRMTPVQALGVGLFQCVAMWPGTSRSMMTIAGATMLGLKPKQAAEFSFLLGLPTLGAACLYKLAKNLKHAADTDTPNLFQTLGVLNVLIGIAVATISAAVAIKWLVGFLNKHGLAAFGVYRIALFIVMSLLVLTGAIQIG